METPAARQFSAEVEVTYRRRMTFTVAPDAQPWETALLTLVEQIGAGDTAGGELTHVKLNGIVPLG